MHGAHSVLARAADTAAVERAILAGVVSETTKALVQDREAQRRSLKARLVELDARRGPGRSVPTPTWSQRT